MKDIDTPSLFDLHGRVAIVTGAGRGIGAAIALAFAGAGADLTLWPAHGRSSTRWQGSSRATAGRRWCSTAT